MPIIDYYKTPDTDEDIYIQTLLEISKVNSRFIEGFQEVNNALATRYTDVKSECMRENKQPHEYRERLLSVLSDFKQTYVDICDQHNLLNTPIKHNSPITYGALFNAIADHNPSPHQEAIEEQKLQEQLALRAAERAAEVAKQEQLALRAAEIARQEQLALKAAEIAKQQEAQKRQQERDLAKEKKRNRPTDQTQQANSTVHKHSTSTITEKQILDAAQNHFDSYKEKHGVGRWPSCKDFSAITTRPLKGESWGTIDKLLRDGGRGLPGGSSLSKLLNEHGLGPAITIDDILTAARQHYADTKALTGTGKWPSSSDDTEITSGPLEGKSWKGVNTALRRGYYGLPSNTSLSKLLKENGCYDDNTISTDDIIIAAKLHFQETKEQNGRGKWPSSKDNTEIKTGPLAGEKWASIHTALRDGHRGLSPYKGGLPAFLKDNDCYDRPITKQDVIFSCLHYKENHPDHKWPTNKIPERINDDSILHGMSWSAVDKRKIDGMSLNQIIKDYEAHPELYEDIANDGHNLSEDMQSQPSTLSL